MVYTNPNEAIDAMNDVKSIVENNLIRRNFGKTGSYIYTANHGYGGVILPADLFF
jgi:hypothetical protein